MRIVLPTTGSRGDVQCYLALGIGLQAAGFKVRMVTHRDFEDFIRSHGLDFYPIPVESRSWHESADGQRMVLAGGNPFRFIRHFVRLRIPVMRDILASFRDASHDADMLLATSTSMTFAHSVGEKLNVPVMGAHLAPMVPTPDLPSCIMPTWPSWLPGRRLYNRLSHMVVGECFWQHMRVAFNQARTEVLGLPPLPFLGPPLHWFRSTPVVCGCSPSVVPPPRWCEHQRLTGYWFLDSAGRWKPPAALLDFLRSGAAPVCVGFGSMGNDNIEEFTRIVLEALEQSGQRGILLRGWGGLAEANQNERVFVADAIPHDWLFRHVAAVVHHGGAGTTAAAIRAGVPSVVVPFMADQPFWGGQVQRLGIGPRPIARSQLTSERLAAALTQAMGDAAMRAAAQRLGEQVRAEDGIGVAVNAIEEFSRNRVPASVRGTSRPSVPWPARHADPIVDRCPG